MKPEVEITEEGVIIQRSFVDMPLGSGTQRSMQTNIGLVGTTPEVGVETAAALSPISAQPNPGLRRDISTYSDIKRASTVTSR